MWCEAPQKLELKNTRIQEQMVRKYKFERQFQNILFDDLIEQNRNILTDNSCLYYRHKTTGVVYSWNHCKNEWKETMLDLLLNSQLFSS